MKAFYLTWPETQKHETPQTPSAESGPRNILQTVSAELAPTATGPRFLLPRSAYVRLLSVENESARRSCEIEALPGEDSR